TPFILITPCLVIVPTPIAIRSDAYVRLYGSLHANPAFCQMAFGPHFPPVQWGDEGTREVIATRDLERCWKTGGLGDFAVGLRAKDGSQFNPGSLGKSVDREEAVDGLSAQLLDEIEWAGYAGVRDATTTSMPDRLVGDEPLPPWQEMVELRYGVHGDYWGRGVAGEAARAVMQWAVSERGVRRFIAETEKANTRSGRVLQKMGFRESGTDYWKEPSETEW
ncbi:hypothetical protein EJ07DRAFT_24532, partial [Lizonia empirigonia]